MEFTINLPLDQISALNTSASMADPSAVDDMSTNIPPYDSNRVVAFVKSNEEEVQGLIGDTLDALLKA